MHQQTRPCRGEEVAGRGDRLESRKGDKPRLTGSCHNITCREGGKVFNPGMMARLEEARSGIWHQTGGGEWIEWKATAHGGILVGEGWAGDWGTR